MIHNWPIPFRLYHREFNGIDTVDMYMAHSEPPIRFKNPSSRVLQRVLQLTFYQIFVGYKETRLISALSQQNKTKGIELEKDIRSLTIKRYYLELAEYYQKRADSTLCKAI